MEEKLEETNYNSAFSDPMGFFDMSFDGDEKGLLLDMFQNDRHLYGPVLSSFSSFSDFLQSPPPQQPPALITSSAEVVNAPMTPNSFSISSSSAEALNDDHQSKTVEDVEADHKENTKKTYVHSFFPPAFCSFFMFI